MDNIRASKINIEHTYLTFLFLFFFNFYLIFFKNDYKYMHERKLNELTLLVKFLFWKHKIEANHMLWVQIDFESLGVEKVWQDTNNLFIHNNLVTVLLFGALRLFLWDQFVFFLVFLNHLLFFKYIYVYER